MEDAATAEISRAQLWQWVHHPEARLKDGRRIDAELYRRFSDEEMAKLKGKVNEKKLTESRHLLDKLVLDKQFCEFLTLIAYKRLKEDD